MGVFAFLGGFLADKDWIKVVMLFVEFFDWRWLEERSKKTQENPFPLFNIFRFFLNCLKNVYLENFKEVKNTVQKEKIIEKKKLKTD